MNWIEELIEKLCPEGVEWKPIGDVVIKTKNIRWADCSGVEFKYIDLSSVDRTTHFIVNPLNINNETAPSRAQQLVKEGDVIFGTTRPLLKRYAVIPKKYDGQICSTGFCVLRPDPNRILTNFLFHLLGTDSFYQYVESNEQGASYPAISDSAIKKFPIPIPPLPIQNEIVKILDLFTQLEAELKTELEAELEARKTQYTYYRDALLNFEGKEVEWKTLGEVALEFGRGKSKHRPRNDSRLYGGDIPFIQTGDIRNASHIICDYTQTYSEFGLKQSKLWPKGTLCITVAANIAETTILGFDSCFPDSVVGFIANPERTSSSYVEYLLSSFKSKLQLQSTGSAQDNINLGTFENLRLPFPPLSEQQRIVSILDKFDALVNDLSSGLPAEIQARRQQYEYYRNKLLTFKNRDHG